MAHPNPLVYVSESLMLTCSVGGNECEVRASQLLLG